MSHQAPPFIAVVGIDFSAHANHVLDEALELTGSRAGELHVLFVEHDTILETLINRGQESAVEESAALEQVRQRVSERIEASAPTSGARRAKRVVAHFRRGKPADQIIQLAADVDADLIVVGSHGHRKLEHFLLGSVAQRVSQLARCALWIVRRKHHDTTDLVPHIEPPCPDCVAKRAETKGRVFWCARHSEHHVRPHVFAYVSDPFYAPESSVYKATPQ